MYLYTCMYTYIYIYIYMYTTLIYIYTYIYTNKYRERERERERYIYIYVYIYMYVLYIYICMYVYPRYLCQPGVDPCQTCPKQPAPSSFCTVYEPLGFKISDLGSRVFKVRFKLQGYRTFKGIYRGYIGFRV